MHTFQKQGDVVEGVAADILGHNKSTKTYGLYSRGSSVEQMTKAIEAIDYSFGWRTGHADGFWVKKSSKKVFI